MRGTVVSSPILLANSKSLMLFLSLYLSPNTVTIYEPPKEKKTPPLYADHPSFQSLPLSFSDFLYLPLLNHPYSFSRIKNFKLPGLEKYTREQLYFISYGRLWCGKMTPEALLQYTQTNEHSPKKWRINGPTQNSPDFAKAFNCPAGSPMNPIKKCEMW